MKKITVLTTLLQKLGLKEDTKVVENKNDLIHRVEVDRVEIHRTEVDRVEI